MISNRQAFVFQCAVKARAELSRSPPSAGRVTQIVQDLTAKDRQQSP